MAHILPSSELFTWCEHGTPLGHPCQFCPAALAAPPELTRFRCNACGQSLPRYTSAPGAAPSGWECPHCRTVWSPSVLACHHCPEENARLLPTMQGVVPPPPASVTAMSLTVPEEMTRPGSYRQARISKEWTEVMPGMECRYGGTDSGPDFALVQFRLTIADDAR